MLFHVHRRWIASVIGGLAASSACALTSDPVFVTATRTPQTYDATLSSISTVTRTEIERTQAQSVLELLSGLPGVDAYQQGGVGKTSGLYLRGASQQQTLVLIDGVRVGSATTGYAQLELIPVDLIERIELVRGPRSSLYGADAVGGVIQIFTRQPSSTGGVVARSATGSNRTRDFSVSVSGKDERNAANFSVAELATAGINALKTTNTFGVVEPDRDPYRNTSASARFSHTFDSAGVIEVHGLHATGYTDFDGWFNHSDFQQQVAGANYRVAPTSIWNASLKAAYTADVNNSSGEFSASEYITRRRHVSWQNDLTLFANGMLTAGLDYTGDHVQGDTVFTRDSRDANGVFAQWQQHFATNELLIALRRDRTSGFGVHSTGNIAWATTTADKTRYTVSYGTAFRAPTFNDLYWPDDGFFKGNPDLTPEKSESLELGLNHNWGTHRVDLRLYHTVARDLIVYVSDPITFAGTMQNFDTARMTGLELSDQWHAAPWRIDTALTFLNAKDAETDNRLPRRTAHTARVQVGYQAAAWSAGTTVLAQGKRFDDAGNTIEIPGYATVNLFADYALDAHWKFNLRVENVFDKSYETAKYYNQPGANFLASVRYEGP